MSYYTKQQLASIAGIHANTLTNRLKTIKWKKKSPGRYLTEIEALDIAAKLQFSLNGTIDHK